MKEGWPGLTPQRVETVARLGLRVILFLYEGRGFDRDVSVGQILDIEQLRDMGTPDYRAVLNGPSADIVTFTFDTLLQQHLVGGVLEGKILRGARIRTETMTKLDEVDASGFSRAERIQRVLDAAPGDPSQASDIFTKLAIDLRLKP